jgi:uncharacterized protein YcbK (DUF882 family)
MSKQTSKSPLLPSLASPTEFELAVMDRALYRERQWYQDAARFQTKKDIKSAIKKRELILVEASKDLKPIARFNASLDGYTPYLTRNAYRASKAFGSLWRMVLAREYNIKDPSLRLAITSMVRTQKYQNILVENGRFAAADSTHCTGNAFDVDISGYYSIQSKNQAISHVDPRRRAASAKIGQLIAQKVGEPLLHQAQSDHYDHRITEAALLAAEVLHEEEAINLIHEFKDTPNACLHIAVSPDFKMS